VLGVIAESSTKLVLPATNELIWGTVAFVLFLLVLWRAGVWKRLGQAMDDRTSRIKSDLEKAEETRKEAERLRAEREEQLRQAREDSRKITEEAREAAELTRRDAQRKAQEDAERILQGARRDIDAERERARRELQREVGVLAVQVAERIVGASLDGDRQLELVDGYIEELSSRNGNGGGEGNGETNGNGAGG
jgi:F-type H+-transporting ATPase subunit b